MILTALQAFTIICTIALGTAVTRFLPFLLFPANRRTPPYIAYLGSVLPFSIIGLLVVYCLKNVHITAVPFGIPEAIAIVCIIIIDGWKNNTLLSIGAGTVVYMLLMRMAA